MPAPIAPARTPVRTVSIENLEARRLFAAAAAIESVPVIWNGHAHEARPNSWLVDFTSLPGNAGQQVGSANALLAKTNKGLKASRRLSEEGLFLVEAPAGRTFAEQRTALAKLGGIDFFEPDFVLSAATTMPDDLFAGGQWSLNNLAQTGGTIDADIDAPEAWNLAQGDGSVVVGVIDSGIDDTHPDLAANIWTNPNEVANDGVDNDANGYVDDIHGWDFVSYDNSPLDDNGHGTHVAGTIAAAGNNGIGVTGVNWNAKVVPLKFMGADGRGYLSDAVAAINYATNLRSKGINLRVTNNSWGGGGYSSTLFNAIKRSGDAGTMFVAAAGNDGADNDASLSYPASYNLANVIAVAATDHNDALASFSNYGATQVDLAAPGVSILSTVPGGYSSFSGTSMASPHVAGAAALAWAYNPSATVQSVRDALLSGVDKVASLAGKVATGGRLNVFNTLTRVGFAVSSSSPSAGQTLMDRPVDFVVNFGNAYAANSVEPSDLAVNGIAASSVLLTDADTLTFRYSTSPLTTVSGTQTMQIAARAISGANGAGLSPWSSTFSYVAPVTDTAAPAVSNVIINDGSGQRSNLSQVTITFSEATNLDTLVAAGTVGDVVQLYGQSDSSTALAWLTPNRFAWDGQTQTLSIDLTTDGFGGSSTTMLANGRYELRMVRTAISDRAGNVLADTDKTANGMLIINGSTGAAAADLFRLGGDLDGDADVDLADVGIVATYLDLGAAGDADGDGDTDLSDLGVLSSYFGSSLPPVA
jgi:subtilisin family serine protease